MVSWMKNIDPTFISIGADSKGHNLPEPPGAKVKELIQELEKFTEVKVKKNLSRLLGGNPKCTKFEEADLPLILL